MPKHRYPPLHGDDVADDGSINYILAMHHPSITVDKLVKTLRVEAEPTRMCASCSRECKSQMTSQTTAPCLLYTGHLVSGAPAERAAERASAGHRIRTVFRVLTEHNLRGSGAAIELAAPVVLFQLSAALSFSQVRFNLEFALSAAAAVPSLHASDNSKTDCVCYVRFGVASCL